LARKACSLGLFGAEGPGQPDASGNEGRIAGRACRSSGSQIRDRCESERGQGCCTGCLSRGIVPDDTISGNISPRGEAFACSDSSGDGREDRHHGRKRSASTCQRIERRQCEASKCDCPC
jgi:hypothetical protein